MATKFVSYGRGRDLDGDGKIGDGLNDGVGPTGHFPRHGAELPSRKPVDGLQSGLIQTVVDNMALGRALKAGLTIPGVGKNLVDPKRIPGSEVNAALAEANLNVEREWGLFFVLLAAIVGAGLSAILIIRDQRDAKRAAVMALTVMRSPGRNTSRRPSANVSPAMSISPFTT